MQRAFPAMSDTQKETPFYIVGLPEDEFEASRAERKFERLTAALTKAFPYIEEVRAVVKTHRVSPDRARYEVKVEVVTPKERHSYEASGYQLADVIYTMVPAMKKLLSSKQSRVTKSHGDSLRKRES